MDSLKYLAWHLIYAYDEVELYKKLASEEIDRKSFAQWVNYCLQNGKPIQTVLTQRHLEEISSFLIQADEQQWRKAYFDFTWYVLIFGSEKVRVELKRLEE